MRLHAVVMLAPLLIASDAAIAAQNGGLASTADDEATVAEAEPMSSPDIYDAVPARTRARAEEPSDVPEEERRIEPEEERRIELAEVRWTVPTRMRVANLAMRWGVRSKDLVSLNPELDRAEAWVDPDRALVVFRADPETPSQSIGAPNRGRLRGGIPLPEGPYWKMRDHRPRAYGTKSTIEALVQTFTAYGEAFPDGPPIHLGEISARRGGRVRPHVSHRTGRDVDIGYIHRPGALGDRHWRTATEETFDAEKNWFLIKALVETGRVQKIFISSRLQRLLIEEARKELSEEALARYFRYAKAELDEPPIIVHWKGHLDHMHVRFECPEGHRRCLPNSR